MGPDKFMDGTIAGNRDNLHRNPPKGRRKTASGVEGNVDLTGHEAADTDYAPDYQHIKLQTFLGKDAVS